MSVTLRFSPGRALRRLLAAVICVALPTACALRDVSPAPSGQTIVDAWARTADSGATGGAYLTVLNHDSVAVELVGASSGWARAVEVHETMDHDGMTHMMARPTITIGARDSLVMRPGGVHLMLIDLARPLTPDDSVPVTLQLALPHGERDSVLVRLPVRTP
jgi:periplasmic copper chaperone A